MVLQHILGTKLAHCAAFMIADGMKIKNINRLESRKLRTTPCYDAGRYILWRPRVLCAVG